MLVIKTLLLNSPKYKKQAINTKAAVCVTKNLENFYQKCIKVFVKNVLFSTAKNFIEILSKAI